MADHEGIIKRLNQAAIMCKTDEGIFGCRINACKVEEETVRTEVTLRCFGGRPVDAFVYHPEPDRWFIHFRDRCHQPLEIRNVLLLSPAL